MFENIGNDIASDTQIQKSDINILVRSNFGQVNISTNNNIGFFLKFQQFS